MSSANCNPYSNVFRARLNRITEMRVRDDWFKNYEGNRKLILERQASGECMDNVGHRETVLTIGAGWSLGRNLHLIKDLDVPIISCDKALKRVLQHNTPFAVTALNTSETECRDWLDIGKTDMWLIAPVTAHPSTFEKWKGQIAFTNPQNSCEELFALVEKETGIPPTHRGANVGYYSIINAVALRASEVVMIGMNYSYETEEQALNATNQDHVIKMKDVNHQWTYTAFDWIDGRREFMEFCLSFLDMVKFTNCSEGGILYEDDIMQAMPFSMWREFYVASRAEK